jgi:tetratricopeptide (TPR) repeat protein
MTESPAATVSGMTAVLALEHRGCYSRGIRLLEALLVSERQSADLLSAKARLLSGQGRLVDALKTGDLASDLWPTAASGHAARAVVLALGNQPDATVVAADRALALEPGNVEALQAQALALADMGATD